MSAMNQSPFSLFAFSDFPAASATADLGCGSWDIALRLEEQKAVIKEVHGCVCDCGPWVRIMNYRLALIRAKGSDKGGVYRISGVSDITEI